MTRANRRQEPMTLDRGRKNAMQSKEYVAYHEAGHAVVAWCLRLRPRRATIVEEGESGGHVLNRKLNRNTRADIECADRFSPGRLRAEKEVMVSMAGELTQRRFNPRSVHPYHAQADRHHVKDILARYASETAKGVDIRTHYKLLQEWTAELLDAKWDLVEAVAHALMERQTLSGEEIRAVVLKQQGVDLTLMKQLETDLRGIDLRQIHLQRKKTGQ